MSNQYIAYYNANCKSIDFRTFKNVKARVQRNILDEGCPDEMKIMFCEYLFKKVWSMYKLPSKDKEKIVPELTKSVTLIKNIVTKGEYLKFFDEEVVCDLSQHFYINRFKGPYFVLQMINDTQLLKQTIINPKYSEEDLKEHFIKWISRTTVFEQRSNLLDVVLRYFPNDRQILGIYEDMKFGGGKNKSIYNNSQNAHHSDVKDSTLAACFQLLKWDADNDPLKIPEGTTFRSFAEWILEKVPTKKGDADIVKCVIERMCIDTTYFTYTDDRTSKTFSISDIFIAMSNYISKSIHKQTLKLILMDELREMAVLCSSGYIARFLSVVSGFDERFTITVSPLVQLHASISNKIQQSLNDASEEIILGSIDEEHKALYISFIKGVVRKWLNLWCEDYGKEFVLENYIGVVAEVSGMDAQDLE